MVHSEPMYSLHFDAVGVVAQLEKAQPVTCTSSRHSKSDSAWATTYIELSIYLGSVSRWQTRILKTKHRFHHESSHYLDQIHVQIPYTISRRSRVRGVPYGEIGWRRIFFNCLHFDNFTLRLSQNQGKLLPNICHESNVFRLHLCQVQCKLLEGRMGGAGKRYVSGHSFIPSLHSRELFRNRLKRVKQDTEFYFLAAKARIMPRII